ncbi:polysaccharide deacetylase family protein [Paenibacillus sp. GCM10012307]|uniref:Polysaccharide deacetylase family protein n=1 Tax=Paenibacillus roseus TaxID=2798579 RepID=A0A934J5B2_9BACL|nr:polysaccharide deacetylase [Paenibacillus roseus]MBJ6360637.1 polysaccharide deacetylase family protein [Paenibacillus roseus]
MGKGLRIVFALLLLCSIMISHTAPVSYAASGKVYFGVNDERLTFPDVVPETHSNVLFVPVRQLAAAMKLTISASNQEVRLTKGNMKLSLWGNDNKIVTGDGKEAKLWMFTRENRLMVPFAYVTQYFGYKLTTLSEGTLVRAANSEEVLSNEKFVEMHKALLKKEESENKLPIYFTFDDGPTAHTNDLLNVLKQFDAKATFFMVGKNMPKYKNELKRIHQEGHQVALHGMTHEVKKFYKSPQSALSEMNGARDQLKELIGVETRLIRSPYGSKPNLTKEYRDKLAQEGYRLWDWNVDSQDWKHPNEPDKIYNEVISAVSQLKKKGIAPVILMHDQATTVGVLPKIIAKLQSEGYRFEILSKDMKPLNFWKDPR